MDRFEGQITLKSPCELPYTAVTVLKSRNGTLHCALMYKFGTKVKCQRLLMMQAYWYL